MAADGPVQDDAHISFAKRLAHNNKDTRQAALKKLKRWLVTKSKQGLLDHSEIIKIWKGLHYSMWYSDKPLTQESLALDISQIMSLLPDIDDAISFFGGFCETIAREWVGIDRQRLDKFYMFLKTALKCVLQFLVAKGWDGRVVSDVVKVLDVRIINSPCPDSLAVYISEQLFSIYSEVSTDSTPTLFITQILACYVTVLSKTPKKDLSRVLMARLFTPIILHTVTVNINLEMLTSHIARLAVQPGILTRNRKLLYRLRNDLTVACGGDIGSLSPLGKHKLESGEPENVENIDSNSQNGSENGVEAEVKPVKKKKKKVKKPAADKERVASKTENEAQETADTVDVQDVPAEHREPLGPLAGEDTGNGVAEEEIGEPVEIGDDEPAVETEQPATAEVEAAPKEVVEQSTESETLGLASEQVVSETTDKSESPIAPSDVDVTDVKESAGSRDLRGPGFEITYLTPPVKTSKRKSTKGSKKTPKKQLKEAECFYLQCVETEQTKGPVAELNGETSISSAAEEVTKTPGPRSLRKRKKKSVICMTPSTVSTSTPIVITSTTKKKVRLSLENNQTYFFKKNASLESPKPFDSTRTPVKGVLKSSPALTRSKARKKSNSRIKP